LMCMRKKGGEKMDFIKLIQLLEDTRSEALTFTDEHQELRYRLAMLEKVVEEILLHLDLQAHK